MAFDLAWNARGTGAFVTDPSYAVPFLSEVYPHTYTNGDGFSINAGYIGTENAWSGVDRSATNDPRIAGSRFTSTGANGTLQIDLLSGSAPGAGDYLIDCAFGDDSAGWTVYAHVFDGGTWNTGTASVSGGTLLIDGSNGGSGYAFAGQHYLDAMLADITASTTWTGTPKAVTIASTTVFVVCNMGNALAGPHPMAHFRLTLQATGGSLWGITLALPDITYSSHAIA